MSVRAGCLLPPAHAVLLGAAAVLRKVGIRRYQEMILLLPPMINFEL